MTLFHVHRSEMLGSRGLRNGSHFSAAGVTRKIRMALKAMHRAIVAAKLRRLRNELMLRGRSPAQPHSRAEPDASRFPQRPMMLGDKWDF
jgi:hypothetical protein